MWPAGTVEPLAGVDSAWLRMDEPSNLMVINGVLVLEQSITRDELAAVVSERLLAIPRFRQRIVCGERSRRPCWEDDPHFDLDHHVMRCRLGPPGGRRALRSAVSHLMGNPFDPARPPWNFHLIEGYGGQSVVMVRLHHCLGDGLALMMVLLSLTEPVAAPADPLGPGWEAADGGSRNPFRELFNGCCDLARVRAAAEALMPDGMRLMLKPAESLARAGRLLRGVAATSALGRLALRPPDPITRFKGALVPEKRAAWSEAVPLDELRGVAHSLGATINDVILTAVTGGLRRYLVDHDDPVKTRLAFRAAVPVNLRPLGSMNRLGNRFGLVFLSMPVGIADPLDRLAEVRRRMRSLRASAEPLVTFGILKLMGRGPLALQRAVVRLLAAKTTAVMTNVPGPRTPLSLAGRTIQDLFFWVPQAGRVGIGISIMSYAGGVRVGIGTDAGLVPDPEAIVAAYEDELCTLMRCGHGLDASWMWGAEKGRKAVSWVLPGKGFRPPAP